MLSEITVEWLHRIGSKYNTAGKIATLPSGVSVYDHACNVGPAKVIELQIIALAGYDPDADFVSKDMAANREEAEKIIAPYLGMM